MPDCSRWQRGFTLLEILVVLLLMAFLAGLALPRAINIYESMRFASERDSVLVALSGLGRRALIAGDTVNIQEPRDLSLIGVELPEGWQVEVVEPLTLGANGSCGSGMLSFSGRGRTATMRVTAPFCKPELISDDA